VLFRLLRDIFRPAARQAAPSAGPAYSPRIFKYESLESAKTVILTPTPDMTTQERWDYETGQVAGAIGAAMNLGPQSRLLDYGCGVGRLAKALIERFGCRVTGVDISPAMLRHAAGYVASDRFSACQPADLDRELACGPPVTGAYACWVLQHCQSPEEDIARIAVALGPGGLFFVLNSQTRWVPTERGWADDGVSVEDLLAAKFDPVERMPVEPLIRSAPLSRESYAVLLRRRA
jgi:SAM-dependent methyltransferase